MLEIPPNISEQFSRLLSQKEIQPRHRTHYLKWLRFFLDFCHKYELDPANKKNLPVFIDKLREKNQSQYCQQQAEHAISIYFEISSPNSHEISTPAAITVPSRSGGQKAFDSGTTSPRNTGAAANQATGPGATGPPPKFPEQWRPGLNGAASTGQTPLKTAGADWTRVFTNLESAIKVRHYSPKTLKAYRGLIHLLQNFVKSKDPQIVEIADVKEFLSFLAVKRNVSASSQNQAFNALLFLFRHVLEKSFPRLRAWSEPNENPTSQSCCHGRRSTALSSTPATLMT